jgi:ABC-type nitrate/sulfonate/bicarbonate transport system substrate-binding protein
MKNTNRKFQRFTVLVFVVILMMTLLPAQMPAQAQDEEGVYSVYLYPTYRHTPHLVAQEKGFFAEEGLDIEFDLYTTTGDAFQAIVNNAVNVILPTRADNFVGGTLAGANYVLIGSSVVDEDGINLVVVEGTELSDVERIGVYGAPSMWLPMIENYVTEQGFSLEDFEFVTLDTADFDANLQAGRIQAVLSTGQSAVTLSEENETLFSDVGYNSFAIQRETLETMPFEDQKAFWRVTIRANEWVSDPANKDELRQILLDTWGELPWIADDDTFEYLYEATNFLTGEELWLASPELGQIVQRNIDFMEKAQGTELPISVESLVDQTALFEVLTEMGYEVPESNND